MLSHTAGHKHGTQNAEVKEHDLGSDPFSLFETLASAQRAAILPHVSKGQKPNGKMRLKQVAAAILLAAKSVDSNLRNLTEVVSR